MIHAYRQSGLNVVIDTYSGAVHILDELSYQVITRWETASPEQIKAQLAGQFPEEEIDTAIKEVEALVDAEQLFSADEYADLSIDLQNRPVYLKAMCLNVAHACNLTCDYCFASQGKYHGERALMSFAVGKAAIDFLLANSGNHRNLDVDFFGGEPLLNFDVVKQIVEYARSREKETGKVFRFTLTTNGMLLSDEVTDYLNEHMYNVVLSLDGRREVHDRLRRTVDGKGSYDTIVPKFQRFVQRRGDKEYYVRGTYTADNLDFTKDVFHMADLGFEKLSMEPVIGNEEESFALQPKHMEVLHKEYERLADEMIRREAAGKPITFYHYMLDLSDGPCIYKRISGCGAGTEYLAVTPWGELFPCHQFVGDENYSLGDVFNGIKKPEMVDRFKSCNCYSRPECQECWAKLYCSGGCAANAAHATGSITGVHPFSCELFKKRIESALAVKAAQAVRAAQQSEQ